VKVDDVQAKVPAILFSGYNGQSQGAALADVLFGKQNPDGHLNFTWYKDDSQLPPMMNYGLNAVSTGGLGRTYQYFTGAPTYPFGYGLNYTTFSISNVTADRHSVSADGTVAINLNVKNTGRRSGTTVAQLYVSTPGAGHGDVPLARLAGFQKTKVLRPGQTQHVTLRVKISDLALWDTSHSREAVTDGTYQFQVGTDASSILARKQVTVTGALTPHVQSVTVQPEAVAYRAGQTIDLTGKNQWLADDTTVSEQPDRDMSIHADHVVEAVDNNQSFVDLKTTHVTYTSSNPGVASVDANGLVRAIKDGVTTITVTVNGVRGSAVIDVQGTLTDSTPPVAVAGKAAVASATFTNGGGSAVKNVALSVQVPAGWSAAPTSPTTFATVAGGSKVTATWQVTPNAGAAPNEYPISYAAISSEGSFSASAQSIVPYASFAAAQNNVGISDDAAPSTGSFDGGSLSFSAQALAANGLVPGQPKTINGVTFTWPGTAVPDNIVNSGQAVPVSGSGSTLGFLGASNNGTGSGTGTVVYSDGTTQSFALGFADWWSGGAIPGTSIAATTPYLNNGTGKQNQTVHVYFASVPLNAAKTVQYVVLPHVTDDGKAAQITALHVFAIGIGG
jgi:beta-glucosidase